MKKVFLLLFLCLFGLGIAQKKKKTKVIAEKETTIIYTEADAEKSSEPRIIAGFLKQNPNHPKSDYFKRKLVQIILTDTPEDTKLAEQAVSNSKNITENKYSSKTSTTTKNTAPKSVNSVASNAGFSGSSTNNFKASTNSEPSDKAKKTAAMLSHMFNYDPSDKDAYINIKNRSKCALLIKIVGKKSYNLDVPAKGQNFIMVEKGEYTLSGMICDAKYTSRKKITKDIELELNVAE